MDPLVAPSQVRTPLMFLQFILRQTTSKNFEIWLYLSLEMMNPIKFISTQLDMSSSFDYFKTFNQLDRINTQEFLTNSVFQFNLPFILAFGMSYEDFKITLFIKYAFKKKVKENMKKAEHTQGHAIAQLNGVFNGKIKLKI